MKQSIRDFMLECSMYEYSKEHYEMMKECSELALMEQYLVNQAIRDDFMTENAALTESTQVVFTEGFFMEAAASDSEIKEIMEAVEQKKDNIFKRAWNGLKALIAKFGRFLAKIAGETLYNEKEVAAKLQEIQNLADNKQAVINDYVMKLSKLQDEVNLTIVAAERFKAAANETVSELKKQNDEKDRQIDILVDRNEKQAENIRQKKAEVAAAQNTISNISAKNRKLEAEVNARREDQYKLADENKALRNEIVAINGTFNPKKNTIVVHTPSDCTYYVKAADLNSLIGYDDFMRMITDLTQVFESGNTKNVKKIQSAYKAAINAAKKKGAAITIAGSTLTNMSNKIDTMVKQADTAMEKMVTANGGNDSSASSTLEQIRVALSTSASQLMVAISRIRTLGKREVVIF